ncbi:MAG: type II toxin-antitoxin system YafQ family toxin [Lachnospiraceae bacterium]|nr:type II toxin-antitoxin system YafQ family toxin [Lachnospiraceae bacterium]
MKYTLKTTTKFRKDYKRCVKRGYNPSLLESVIEALLNGESLDEKYRDHPLHGNYEGFNECHILPDWLLIYFKDDNELILIATRTGTHSDLFEE